MNNESKTDRVDDGRPSSKQTIDGWNRVEWNDWRVRGYKAAEPLDCPMRERVSR